MRLKGPTPDPTASNGDVSVPPVETTPMVIEPSVASSNVHTAASPSFSVSVAVPVITLIAALAPVHAMPVRTQPGGIAVSAML